MLNDVDFRESSSKLVFQLMNGKTDVGSGYFSELDACAEGNINYSEFMPEGWGYEYPTYVARVREAIEKTHGLEETFYYSTAADDIYNHIDQNTAVQYNVILSTELRGILLKAPLSDSATDTDNDGLTDWQEADTQSGLIHWNDDGSIVLPTLGDYIDAEGENLPYVKEGLAHYFTYDVPPVQEIMEQVYAIRILPIKSDPTNPDSDGDGLLDNDDPEPLVYQKTEIYSRDAAFQYSQKWFNDSNCLYYSYSSDCANFVSQCLHAGNFSMNSDWHSYATGVTPLFYVVLASQIPVMPQINNMMFTWNISENWRKADNEYEYFKGKNYSKEVITIDSPSEISNAIAHNKIQVGDLMYFDEDGDGIPNHATIISKINRDMIYYAAHTEPRRMQKLTYFLDGTPNHKAYIVILRDKVILS